MESRNELLDEWVGAMVAVVRWIGPLPDEEQVNAMAKDPANVMFDRPPLTRVGFYQLVSYDQFGVILRPAGEGATRFFVAWASVIQIYGLDPEVAPQG